MSSLNDIDDLLIAKLVQILDLLNRSSGVVGVWLQIGLYIG